ncbi:hypothetical protein FB479_111129 [Brevibacillus sp. AG162]|uniref:hypothetical protein n=1 Tax=Brevibacillus sp. AG162 TaxID=2572910 RepID=UPI001151710A|nr:hypothetical protein [Brevibacillus sp. AG162]TQK53309.1 hypothetical protein FB479_111129 [Brevibacillus sp. AG162]
MKISVLINKYGVEGAEKFIEDFVKEYRIKFNLWLGLKYVDTLAYFMPYYRILVQDPQDELQREILTEKIKRALTLHHVEIENGLITYHCEAYEGMPVITLNHVKAVTDHFGTDIKEQLSRLEVKDYQLQFMINQLDEDVNDFSCDDEE